MYIPAQKSPQLSWPNYWHNYTNSPTFIISTITCYATSSRYYWCTCTVRSKSDAAANLENRSWNLMPLFVKTFTLSSCPCKGGWGRRGCCDVDFTDSQGHPIRFVPMECWSSCATCSLTPWSDKSRYPLCRSYFHLYHSPNQVKPDHPIIKGWL